MVGLSDSGERHPYESKGSSEDKTTLDKKELSGLRIPCLKIDINIEYIHFYMIVPPKYMVSKVVEAIKFSTSRTLK